MFGSNLNVLCCLSKFALFFCYLCEHTASASNEVHLKKNKLLVLLLFVAAYLRTAHYRGMFYGQVEPDFCGICLQIHRFLAIKSCNVKGSVNVQGTVADTHANVAAVTGIAHLAQRFDSSGALLNAISSMAD